MQTTERETPRMIMGIFGVSGHPGKGRRMRWRRSSDILLPHFCCFVVKLTVHLQIVSSGPRLTFNHVKRHPALIIHHQCARHGRAFVPIWKRTRTHTHINHREAYPPHLYHHPYFCVCTEKVKGYWVLCCAVAVTSISQITIWCVLVCVDQSLNPTPR